MYHPDSVVKLHQKIFKDAGLAHIRFHDLRHTFATLATYTHATNKAQEQAAAKMESLLK